MSCVTKTQNVEKGYSIYRTVDIVISSKEWINWWLLSIERPWRPLSVAFFVGVDAANVDEGLPLSGGDKGVSC